MEDNIEEEKIYITRNGKKIECDILFTFECEENNKTYIGYTDGSKVENGDDAIFVSSFDPVIGTNELYDVTSQEELEMIEDVIKDITKKIR